MSFEEEMNRQFLEKHPEAAERSHKMDKGKAFWSCMTSYLFGAFMSTVGVVASHNYSRLNCMWLNLGLLVLWLCGSGLYYLGKSAR